jgi:hypothetical protein
MIKVSIDAIGGGSSDRLATITIDELHDPKADILPGHCLYQWECGNRMGVVQHAMEDAAIKLVQKCLAEMTKEAANDRQQVGTR